MFHSLSSEIFFLGDKISADSFKDEIIPSLKVNDRIKLSLYVVINNVRDHGKPQCKFKYKVFEEQDGYDMLLENSPFLALIRLKDFLGGIQHCVTVGGKWIFDSNISFGISLTHGDMGYCFIDSDETKGLKCSKVLLKSVRLFNR